MDEALKILDQYWGFKSFKPLQEKIIDAVIDNQDVLALLPTGGGKSLCYQLPALMQDGICVVVSPLIALMKDQVSALKQKGIKAVSITSGISYKDLDTILDNCIYGNIKFLYLSPERLQQDIVQERLQLMKVSLIAVDEAHCISQWGHDFRPAYKQISTLRTLLPSVNVLALTATAKPVVIKEIIQDLDFIDYEVFQASYNRANIGYQVIYTEDKEFRLVEILNKNPGLAIIYVRSRRKAEEINTYLNNKAIKSEFFHGGIDSKAKESKLEIFMQERVRVMVATTAFGMGIDKSNVRSVFHFDLPENLESYYQESGRAGRDGLPSNAFTLVKKGDEKKLEEQFLGNLPNAEDVKLIYRKLCNFLYVPYGEGANTTFNLNFNEFCTAYKLNSSLVYNVFNLLDRTGLIKMDPHFTNKVKLQFIVENKMLFAYFHKQKNYQTLVKAILRSYGGIMDNLLNIDIQKLAVKSGLEESKVLKILNSLHQDEIVNFEYANTDTIVTFLEPREDDKAINRISPIITQNTKNKTEQIKAVKNYIKNDKRCRNLQILSYFGEEAEAECGICSVCLTKPKTEIENPKEIRTKIILQLEGGPSSSRKIVSKLNYPEKEVLKIIEQMLDNDIIEITSANTYKIKYALS